MNPYSFEEFTKLLLRYIGFEKLKVTQKSNDKGIDGYGIYKINGLVTYKVAFQCKRYTNTPISSSEIRDFRGSLSSEFDRGLFITTSTFSPSAREEAESSGKTLIELIDGENLIEKIAELEIGLKPKTEYEIDFEFYNKYK
jgi:restriction system protein